MDDEEPPRSPRAKGEEHPSSASREESAPAGGGSDHDMNTDKGDDGNSQHSGSAAMRPVFLGNLNQGCTALDIKDIFERPVIDPDRPILVDRIDLKRGYCFVFLKDATCQADKDRAEQFVSEINGMAMDKVSQALRSEFARGDGRIKRKEDDRRKKIQPSETLFVVNFHENTTKREDLQMLFQQYGELVRIDMKRNYAFVQFRTVEEARKAKEATNGGKLDQSVITVEYVARRMGESDRRRNRSRDRGGGFRSDRGGGAPLGGYGRGPAPLEYGRGGYRGGRVDDRYADPGYRRDDRYYDDLRGGYRGRDRSPPRDHRAVYDDPPHRGRVRSRSRSRSPPMYRNRSRSPPRGRDYYDDRDRDDYKGGGRVVGGGSGGGGGGGYESGGYRARSSERDDYRGGRGRSNERDYRGDRDRGYRG